MGKFKLFVVGSALAVTGVVGLSAPAGAADGALDRVVVGDNLWCC